MDVRRAAYHEAGHVLAAMRWLGDTARAVSIGMTAPGRFGQAAIPVTSAPRNARTDAQWRRIRVPESVMFVGGLAAEEVAGFARSKGISELETIVRVQGRGAVNAAMTWGLPPVVEATDDIQGALAALVDAFPTKRDPLGRFLRVYSFTVRFLERTRATLDRVASELAMRGALTAAEIELAVGADLSTRRG